MAEIPGPALRSPSLFEGKGQKVVVRGRHRVMPAPDRLEAF